MIGSRFYGVSWFGTATIASAVFGLPVGFLTIWIVSLLTAPPPKTGAGPRRQRTLSQDRAGYYWRSAGARYSGWCTLVLLSYEERER